MRNFDENLIRIDSYEVLGQLPDLFTMEDGTKVENEQQWQQRRQELFKSAVGLQFGEVPPEPEFLEVEPLDSGTNIQSFRITTGTKARPLSFIMRVIRPEKPGVYPAIVDGDLCWRYAFDKEFIDAAISQNVMLVLFNRTELAPDRADNWNQGPIYKTYPDLTFGTVAAWAWGYSRCVDALEKLGIADMNNIAFSGHSRGGKVTLLAGLLDQRAAIVNPNNSGAGGAGCYRVHMTATKENGLQQHNETLKDLLRGSIGFWFNPAMQAYTECEEKLPFDQHYLKALVAPRILIQTEAASDLWANGVGTWQTAMAAKEAYRFLGAEENILLYFRKGYHCHMPEDIGLLAKVMNQRMNGQPFEEGSFKTPFHKPELIFDWRSPK